MKKSPKKKSARRLILPLILSFGVIGLIAFLVFSRNPENTPIPNTPKAPLSNTGDTLPATESGATACTMEYAPVCSKSGKTYSNACMAEKAWEVIGTLGVCDEAIREAVSDFSASGGGLEEINEILDQIIPSDTSSGGISELSVDVSGSGSEFLAYSNDSVGYGFSLPKRTYYSGFGAQDGATHSVGIGRGASPESFELSEVKVRFYKGKILAELQNAENGFFEDSSSGIAYLALSGSTLSISGDRSISSDIIDTVIRTAFVK